MKPKQKPPKAALILYSKNSCSNWLHLTASWNQLQVFWLKQTLSYLNLWIPLKSSFPVQWEQPQTSDNAYTHGSCPSPCLTFTNPQAIRSGLPQVSPGLSLAFFLLLFHQHNQTQQCTILKISPYKLKKKQVPPFHLSLLHFHSLRAAAIFLT